MRKRYKTPQQPLQVPLRPRVVTAGQVDVKANRASRDALATAAGGADEDERMPGPSGGWAVWDFMKFFDAVQTRDVQDEGRSADDEARLSDRATRAVDKAARANARALEIGETLTVKFGPGHTTRTGSGSGDGTANEQIAEWPEPYETPQCKCGTVPPEDALQMPNCFKCDKCGFCACADQTRVKTMANAVGGAEGGRYAPYRPASTRQQQSSRDDDMYARMTENEKERQRHY